MGLPDRRRPASAAGSRVRAARRSGCCRWPCGSRESRRSSRMRARSPAARRGRSSRLHADVAGKRVGGVAALGRQAVETAEAAAGSDLGVAAVLPRLRAAADAASEALDAFGRWLTDEVAPSATGDAALGEPLFSDKLRHTLRDPEVTPGAILARAESEFAAVRAEMVRIARDAWPTWRAGRAGTRRRRRAGPRGARRDRRRPPGRRRARLVQPRGAGPGRGVLPRARDHRTRRRAARHRLDPRVHALVRRRDAGLARAARPWPEDVLLDHARCPRTGRPSSPSRTCAR